MKPGVEEIIDGARAEMRRSWRCRDRTSPAQPRRIEADDEYGYCIVPGELMLDGPNAKLHAHGELTMA